MSEKKDDKKEWVVDCSNCGGNSIVVWKEACEKGCPICCSFKVSVYHEESLER